MIIISQDKKTVINSDNVKIFNVFDEGDDFAVTADWTPVARFDTEKEAMDTLNEMAAMIIAGNKDYVIS